MAPGASRQFKPRDIIRADLAAVLTVAAHTDTMRMCVVVEVDPSAGRMVLVFAANDTYHHPKNCYCIHPGTDDAKPFGTWLRKSTHFSAYNVVDAPMTLPATIVGAIPMGFPDQFDKFFPVVVFADLNAMTRRMN